MIEIVDILSGTASGTNPERILLNDVQSSGTASGTVDSVCNILKSLPECVSERKSQVSDFIRKMVPASFRKKCIPVYTFQNALTSLKKMVPGKMVPESVPAVKILNKYGVLKRFRSRSGPPPI